MKIKILKRDSQKNAQDFAKQGYAAKNQGNFEDANQFFTRAIELDPNKPEYFLNRGQCFLILNIYSKAIVDFSQAEALNCDPGELYMDYARALSFNGEQSPAFLVRMKKNLSLLRSMSRLMILKIWLCRAFSFIQRY